jgi:predicted nucleic acid-binding protein
MALKYLVDTSVAARVGNERVRAVVRALLLAGEVARTSIVDLEIGNQARNSSEWNTLLDAVASFPLIETNEAHIKRALQVQRILAERSQRGRKVPDFLIAAVAEQLDLTVLHYDADFEIIAATTGQQVQWVVPPGEVS